MCGLTGIFDPYCDLEVNHNLLKHMNDLIHHRGPDGEGFYYGPGIGLGHRRLSIIDLSTGDQPMLTPDKKLALVFNGEIYNYQETRALLESKGHKFQTKSDTEVILYAWREWGEACLAHLNGMFVFALWDQDRRSLFIARDRVGKKPLFYTQLPNGQIIFGSELKTLLCHPELVRLMDHTAIEDYFAYGYIPDPKTIYQFVKKLPPAHYLLLEKGQDIRSPHPYWTLAFDETNQADPKTLCDELLNKLNIATKLRMISDVPLGAFLSGGVDSSGIVALMANQSPDPINTFSIGFRQKNYDESLYAQMMSERYHTNHTSEIVDSNDFSLIDKLVNLYDEPFGDSSAIPTYQVSAIARKKVTVALSGDGGDEFFGGYRRYKLHSRVDQIRNMIPSIVRKPIFEILSHIYPKLDWAPRFLRAQSTFKELSRDQVEGYFLGVSVLDDDLRSVLYSSSFKSSLKGYHAVDHLKSHATQCHTKDPLFLAQYLDLKTWLPGDILTKVDRASMGVSLEVRSPLLDHTLIEWSAHLPASMKLSGGEGKYILKKALEPYVPHDILYRPKMGFSIPLAEWFRGPLKDCVRTELLSKDFLQNGFFDPEGIQKIIDLHQSGKYNFERAIWLLFMFNGFYKNVHTAPPSFVENEYRTAVR